ncbi:MAG: 16S rRNA (cytosine(967)-C(5))-methyltransferase RsmB [Sarcina sp.]
MNIRKIIVEILDEVFYRGAYSNIELNRRLNNIDADPKDKALITEVVYGTIKYKKTIDIILENFVKTIDDIDKDVLNILRSAVYQMKYLDRVPDYAVVNEAVNLSKIRAKNLSRFVNGVLRNYLRNKDKKFEGRLTGSAKLAYEYSFEKWMIDLLIAQYGVEVTEKILAGLNTRPAVTVRVNSLKDDYDEVLESLENEGYDVEEGYICPEAIIIKKGSSIEKNELHQKGLISVQDESAMLVAPLLDPKEGDIVMDLCSAPGGKATHLSEMLMNTGKVYAFDIYEHKLDLIRENVERLGITNIETGIMDAAKLEGKYVEFADKILLDVPCSGLGIIRKKPEIKWTKNGRELQNIAKIQTQILNNAWIYLKKGGELVYSTCTLNKRENEDIIERFLSRNRDASIEKAFIGQNDNIIYNGDGSITILPNEYMDGFFMVKLKKN